MRRRAAAETTRPDRALVRTVLDPFLPIKSSSTEIAEPNFSTCHCARSRTLLVAAGAHPLSPNFPQQRDRLQPLRRLPIT